jgi:hypothetical protein
VKRAVKYSNLTIDGFSFELRYNASGTHGLPPGVLDPKLAEYTVSGIKDAIKRWVGRWVGVAAWGVLVTEDLPETPSPTGGLPDGAYNQHKSALSVLMRRPL